MPACCLEVQAGNIHAADASQQEGVPCNTESIFLVPTPSVSAIKNMRDLARLRPLSMRTASPKIMKYTRAQFQTGMENDKQYLMLQMISIADCHGFVTFAASSIVGAEFIRAGWHACF